jgi:hypothetical protein
VVPAGADNQAEIGNHAHTNTGERERERERERKRKREGGSGFMNRDRYG